MFRVSLVAQAAPLVLAALLAGPTFAQPSSRDAPASSAELERKTAPKLKAEKSDPPEADLPDAGEAGSR